MGTNWQGVYDTLGFLYFSVKRFDRTRASVCALAHSCTPVYLCLCGNVTLSSVCLCVCDLGNTHSLYERHITLQMTLLDGDGPFNYSTLMQSAVNTLNQAAEEEAAYPSSLPFPPPLFPSLAHTLHLFSPLSWSRSHLLHICFTSFPLSFIHFPSSLPALSESTVCRHSPASKLH